jgi:hypothetical protein
MLLKLSASNFEYALLFAGGTVGVGVAPGDEGSVEGTVEGSGPGISVVGQSIHFEMLKLSLHLF